MNIYVWLANSLKDLHRINNDDKFEEIVYLMKTWMKSILAPIDRIVILKLVT